MTKANNLQINSYLLQTEALAQRQFIEDFTGLGPDSCVGLIEGGVEDYISLVDQQKMTGNFFTIKSGQKVLARLAVNQSRVEAKRGYFGLFQAHQSCSSQEFFLLFESAQKWLKERGVVNIIGPINFSTWFNNRIRIDDHPLQFRWNQSASERERLFYRDCGLSVLCTFCTWHWDSHQKMFDSTRSSYDKVLAEGYQIDVIDLQQRDADLKTLLKTLKSSFEDNIGFEPIDDLNFVQKIYRPVLALYDFSPTFFLKNAEGDCVGYIMAFYDQGHLVIKNFAVVPGLRGKHLSSALVHQCLRQARNDGYFNMIAAFVREGIKTEKFFLRMEQTQWKHHYQLLSKVIS